MTFLHGPVVICRVGIDVNSLSSAWPRKVFAVFVQYQAEFGRGYVADKVTA